MREAALIAAVGTLAMITSGCSGRTPGKKLIIADYFPYHRSRPHDGRVGSWQQNLTAKDSKAAVTHFTYNADLIDEAGHHQLAAPAAPLVGLQSDLDPDYQEYQILLAKTAHVDAFVIEWALPGDINADITLRSILAMAERYDFKIGVNWVEGAFFEWIAKHRDGVKTRADKLVEYHKSLQYLMTEIYGADTGLLVGDRPLVLLFGGAKGTTLPPEFASVLEKPLALPKGRGKPLFTKNIGVNRNPKYRKRGFDLWSPLVDGAFGWVQAHGPMSDEPMPEELKDKFDYYMGPDHMVVFQNAFRKTVNEYYDKGGFSYRIQSAVPGFDNRGCAGWSSTLCYMGRDKGEVYRRQWAHHVKYRDKIDAVLLVTWNDYTEATVVEPTREYGDRELAVTEEYGARYKGIPSRPEGIKLPPRLFALRKRRAFLAGVGFDVARYAGQLDRIGQLISTGKYKRAATELKAIEQRFDRLARQIETDQVSLEIGKGLTVVSGPTPGPGGAYTLDQANGLGLLVDEAVAAKLREHHWDGLVSFEYLDKGRNRFQMWQSPTRRSRPSHNSTRPLYGQALQIIKTDTGKWTPAKARLYKVNAALDHKLLGKVDFAFGGGVRMRNVKFEWTVYRRKGGANPK